MSTTDLDALTGTRVLKTLGLWLVMAVAVCVASWYGLYWLMPSWRGTDTPTLVLVAEAYALLPIAAVIVFNGVGSLARAVRFTPTSGRYIVIAVGVWAGMLCVLFGLYTAFGALSGSLWHPVIDFVRHASDMSRLATATPIDWALIVIRAVALAGLTEELLFRGLLFGWLRPRLGFAATILVTSVLFALMHYFVILAPGVFLYSLVAGWLRELSGSVLPALVMHILTDAAMLIAATVLVANHIA
jgi:CAAX protease family protein